MSWLSLDELSIIEEAVENLPEEYEGHQDQVEQCHQGYLGLEVAGQLLPLGRLLVVLLQVPLVKGGPGTRKEEEFIVPPQALDIQERWGH